MKSADTEPTMSMELNKTEFNISYQNTEEIIINYYEIDLEILFSRSPFLSKERKEFSFVKVFSSL